MKFLKRASFLLLGVLFAAGISAQSDLKRGNKQYELSAFTQAVESYKEFLKKSPNHVEANSKIADSYRHLNQLDKALIHYQKALGQDGGGDESYVFQYGLTLQSLANYEDARRVFERLANDSPDFRTRARQFADACTFAMGTDEPPLFKIANEYANSANADYGAALLKSERLVFASARSEVKSRDNRSAPSNKSGGNNRLLVAQRDKNNFLETPVLLHAGMRSDVNEAPVAYSPDGEWVAITKNNFTDGVRQIPTSGMELNLYLAQADDNGDWTNAVPFPHNSSNFSTGYPAFSADGKALYFSSNRQEGYGGYDLYVSYRVGNTWSAPENLGGTVNSIGNEISPFHDGSSLYFASDYHKGFGGFDIFRAEESGDRWATVYHGGSGLNSSADDYGYVFDPLKNIGYFVSNRVGGKGNEDLYRITKESDNVVIKVTDASNGQPLVDASIDLADCGDRSYQTNAGGIFNFQLLGNLNCSARVSKPGYLSASVKITSLGLQQNRSLEVALVNESAAYKGKTINGNNGYVLDEVRVIATNKETGDLSETTSDQRGDYSIALKPNTPYILRFSKAGFRDVNFNFQTGGASDVKRVDNIELLPVGASSGGGIGAKEPDKPVTSGDPAPSTIVAGGYSVQVAAASSSKVDLKPFQTKVGSLGSVYVAQEGGKSKVRVGVFGTRAEAEDVQKKLKTKGYAGTFIVAETSREVTTSTLTPKKIETPTQPAANQKKVANVTDLDGYMVRLATYKDLKNFNMGTVDDVGVVQFVEKGAMTIVLLTGYADKDAADAAVRKAKVRGFPEAFVVRQDKGELRKSE